MSLATIRSRACFGIEAPLVTVEVHLSNGLPSVSIVGLASAEVRESRERVRCAIINSGFDFPVKRIIINLGPADLPKSGGRYDLAIALGILIASGQLSSKPFQKMEVLGELSLTGDIRSVRGVLLATLAANKARHKILIPSDNAEEAKIAETSNVWVVSHFSDFSLATEQKPVNLVKSNTDEVVIQAEGKIELADIRGNHFAKKALLIAASGGHNILFSGEPGSGKTLLAKSLPSLLNKMSRQEAIEIATLESIKGEYVYSKNWYLRRFRQPHHNCSVTSITGGGKEPTPGELSLAHKGVLFFDELPEFKPSVLESLRQPMEDGRLTVSRANWKVDFPAEFQFIAAMNPCPCGNFTSDEKDCRCSKKKIQSYLERISGPLLDRIDLQVMVNNNRVSVFDLAQVKQPGNSELKQVVNRCRENQYQRQGCLNARLDTNSLMRVIKLEKDGKKVIEKMVEKKDLSFRAQLKVLKVARTIADLDNNKRVQRKNIIEALSFRCFDQLLSRVNKLD